MVAGSHLRHHSYAGAGGRICTQLSIGTLYTLSYYCKGNMVWRGHTARQLTADETEVSMGLPECYSRQLKKGPFPDVETARCHAIGKSFHVPSIVVIITLLFKFTQVAVAGIPEDWRVHLPTSVQRHHWQQEHIQGTIWDSVHSAIERGDDLERRAVALMPNRIFQNDEGQEAVERACNEAKDID